jgi:hypothetical protein
MEHQRLLPSLGLMSVAHAKVLSLNQELHLLPVGAVVAQVSRQYGKGPSQFNKCAVIVMVRAK